MRRPGHHLARRRPDGVASRIIVRSNSIWRAIAQAIFRVDDAKLGEDLTRHIADIDQKLAGFDRFGRLAHELRLHLESQDRN